MEECSFLGQTIEGWGLDHRVAVGASVGPAPVVGDGEEDVGLLTADPRGLVGLRLWQQS